MSIIPISDASSTQDLQVQLGHKESEIFDAACRAKNSQRFLTLFLDGYTTLDDWRVKMKAILGILTFYTRDPKTLRGILQASSLWSSTFCDRSEDWSNLLASALAFAEVRRIYWTPPKEMKEKIMKVIDRNRTERKKCTMRTLTKNCRGTKEEIEEALFELLAQNTIKASKFQNAGSTLVYFERA